MALSRAGLIVDTTSTSGTGTYTLNDPAAPGGALRTLADAVADGHVANGDTVYYWVVDTTTQGSALAWEHGIGTVGSNGTTLARTTILESSNSDAAVNWGSGGSRTVRIGVGVSGLALLAAANTFTSAQTFSASGVSLALTGDPNPQLTIAEAGAAASALSLLDIDSSNARIGKTSASGNALLDLDAVPTGGTGTATIRLFRTANTTGTKTLQFLAGDGSGTVVHSITNTGAAFTGTLTKDGTAVALQGVLSAPSGTKMVFKQATPPTGWTKDSADNDAALRVVSGTPGVSGGTRGLSSATVGSTTLTTSQIPSHSHLVEHNQSTEVVIGEGAAKSNVFNYTGGVGTESTTSTTGSGGSHDHALALKYVDVIVATKT